MGAHNGKPGVKPRDQCHIFRADCGISRGICYARLYLVPPQIEARHLRLKVVELKSVCAQPFWITGSERTALASDNTRLSPGQKRGTTGQIATQVEAPALATVIENGFFG